MAKRTRPPDDDGRTIVSMDVEGMPERWKPRKPASDTLKTQYASEPSRRESFWAVWGAAKAMLLVVGVIGGGLIAFIALLLWLWK